jgi:class 3 adenylate cyclase/putative methionine-R-sulfoxide reductase with GAF domain
MRRRAKAGGEQVKKRRRKAIRLAHRNAPKASRHHGSSTGNETEVARLTRERDEALEQLSEALKQQTAASEVLRLISGSPSELGAVFDAILVNATRLCEARFGILLLWEGDAFRTVALHNAPPAFVKVIRPAPVTSLGRLVATKQVDHVADMRAEKGYVDRHPGPVSIVELAGARTVINVPILKDDELIGAIGIYRQEVRPFTDKQIALVQNFAAQAVIAIENARLLNELRESLEQQTATADVLRVISSSPGDLEPVFQAMLANATRICDARFASMFLRDGDAFRSVAATQDAPRAYVEARTKSELPLQPSPEGPLGRVAITKEVAQTADLRELRSYQVERHPFMVAAVELGGFRTALSVPMLKDNELVGAINILRQEVRPFTEKQIELVKNFAAQAVIAIENTRLLNELRQSLDRQTATSDVLHVISSSPGDLKKVFEAILENATRICQANFGILNFYETGGLRMGAMHNVPSAFADWHADWLQRHSGPYQPIPGSPPDLVIKTKKVCHVVDNASEAAPGRAATLGGARSTVCVPILKDDVLIGTITIFRQEVRPFTDKQIALLASFANQAVIAIENARLLDDLNKLNQQLEQRVTDQVEEIERMSRLRRFLPPQVADLIVASGTEKQLESHRREITALFCDLRGFTGFSESSDPEDVMALLAEYHAAIGTIINKYSGTLERYAGDGVMVIFNDPVPVENPALQAVLMALEMRNAIEALMQKWRLLGHDIGFGIGIAHGFATLGTIGFEGRRDYAAIGTVSNVASRLCDEAKPSQILISPRVLLAVDKAVSVEQVGEFALKGIRRPMQAYNVLQSKSN